MCFRTFSRIRIAPTACVSRRAEKRQIVPIICAPLGREVRHKAAVYHRCGFLLVDKIIPKCNSVAEVRRSHARADTCGYGSICVRRLHGCSKTSCMILFRHIAPLRSCTCWKILSAVSTSSGIGLHNSNSSRWERIRYRRACR